MKLNKGQKSMMNKCSRWVHIGGRRTGKSFGLAYLAASYASRPGAQVIVLAPNGSTSILEHLETVLQDRASYSKHAVDVIGGGKIKLFYGDSRLPLRGIGRVDFAAIDEPDYIDNVQEVVEALAPSVIESRVVFAGTPRHRKDYLESLYRLVEDPNYSAWGRN